MAVTAHQESPTRPPEVAAAAVDAAAATLGARDMRESRVDMLLSRGGPGKTFLVETAGPAVFIKRAAPAVPWEDATAAVAELAAAQARRETTIARAASAIDGLDGAPIAPHLLASVDDLLVFEGLAEWGQAAEGFGEQPERDAARAAATGRLLARLHSAPVPTHVPRATDRIPRPDALRLEQLATLPGQMADLLASLQADAAAIAALAELAICAEDPPQIALIHGDVKLDNVLVESAGSRVVLVDWEMGGSGDPAWDLGALVGDLLSRWLVSAQVRCAAPVRRWLADARVSQSTAAGAARAALDAYSAAGGSLPGDSTLGRYTGVCLLHRAQALVEHHGEYSAFPFLLGRIGARLLSDPEPALATLVPGERAE